MINEYVKYEINLFRKKFKYWKVVMCLFDLIWISLFNKSLILHNWTWWFFGFVYKTNITSSEHLTLLISCSIHLTIKVAKRKGNSNLKIIKRCFWNYFGALYLKKHFSLLVNTRSYSYFIQPVYRSMIW